MEPESGWSEEQIEALIWAGVPVVRVDDSGSERSGCGLDVVADSWLDEVGAPETGPVSWLTQRAPGAALLADLETLPADMVEDDYDAVELVALWTSLEAHCAAGKRLAAAALARRRAMATGLVGLDGLGFSVGDQNIASDELSLRLGISRRAAKRLISTGQAMAGIGIPTGDALLAGHLEAWKADQILEAIDELGSEAALMVQERVLPKAAHLGPGRLRRELAAAVAAVDPDGFEDRCAYAAQARRVDRPRALPHGMASLYAVLPAAEATQVYRALDAAARSAKGCGDEGRTMDQLRADALALLATAALQSGWIGPPPEASGASHTGGGDYENGGQAGGCGATSSAGAGGRDRVPEGGTPAGMRIGSIGGMSAHIKVVVPYTLLMDDPPPGGTDPPEAPAPPGTVTPPRSGSDPPDRGDDPPDGGGCLAVRTAVAVGEEYSSEGEEYSSEGAGLPARHVPVPDQLTIAELEGYGPIPATVARALAAGSTWARLVLDPIDRTVLEASRETYQPPASMARLVRAAQPYCAQPSCSVASDSADLHHRIPWPIGATDVWSLDPGCRRDHLLVTHAGWHYEQDDGASRTWTTTTGHTYVQGIDDTVTMAPKAHSRYDGPPPY